MSFVPPVPPPVWPPRDGLYAALDLGTNNCRMLVARALGRAGFQVVDAFSRPTRLGEGLAVTGALSDAAMERTVEALKACAAKLHRRGVVHVRAVATEACRRASNCRDFIDRVADQTGIALEIISPAEEARLALAGCAPLLNRRIHHALVFDIGGGSTELMWVRVGRGGVERIEAMASLPYGVVTLAEQVGARLEEPRGYDSVVRMLMDALTGFGADVQAGPLLQRGRSVQMLGTSGTVTTLAAVHLGLARYDRALVDGIILSFAAVRRVSRLLAGLPYDRRARHPCIGADRVELVLAGCAILEAICRIWPVGTLRVADRGVREGILLDLITGHSYVKAAE